MADEFMIVSGIPQFIGKEACTCYPLVDTLKISLNHLRNNSLIGDEHVTEIAAMALDLLAGSVVFQVPHKPNKKINLRRGFHREIQ